MKSTFSIGTNVSLADWQMIKFTVPNWLHTFKDRVSEIVLVADPQKPTGRLGKMHKELADFDTLTEEIEKLKKLDSRIKMTTVWPKQQTKLELKKWFKKDTPMRCQGGTPVAAFIQAIEEVESEIVLRCDSDQLFYENGWLDKAFELLEKDDFDVIEPPLLGLAEMYDKNISTQAFLLRPESFIRKCLPIKAYRLDLARQIHRFLNRRSPWLALEEMLQKEKELGNIRHCNLGDELGFSLHIRKREYILLPGFENIVRNFQDGKVPELQRAIGRNFSPDKWSQDFWNCSC